jgi:hypothetical protein
LPQAVAPFIAKNVQVQFVFNQTNQCFAIQVGLHFVAVSVSCFHLKTSETNVVGDLVTPRTKAAMQALSNRAVLSNGE